MTFLLKSSAFADGAWIPQRHTCDGDDLSPALSWSGAPKGCKSFVLLCEDPDAPRGTWHHWAIFDIPPDQTSLSEGFPAGEHVGPLRQAVNDFKRSAYGGPCPPPGHGPHRYRFRLLALSGERLEVPERANCRAVTAAAERLALGEAALTGRYER